MKKFAIISTYDKSEILDFAKVLKKKDFTIISTGGTAKYLEKNGIKIISVSSFTGFDEILGGRVKSLHPKIFAGILARKEDNKKMNELDFVNIEIVCVNLYPFSEKKDLDISFDEKIEYIDVGGPSMLRAAGKNFDKVLVLSKNEDIKWATKKIIKDEKIDTDKRKQLASKVFYSLSNYDSTIANFLEDKKNTVKLRYGENPDEDAEIIFTNGEKGIANGDILQGKKMSYNNFLDGDAAINILNDFEKPTTVIIKHRNPCGVASSNKSIYDSFLNALACDRKSPFGGVFAINRKCDKKIAKKLKEFFLDLFIAPDFDEDAIEIFSKKKNLRLVKIGDMENIKEEKIIRSISGGKLIKYPGKKKPDFENIVSKKKPSSREIDDLKFAFKVCKNVISNSIVIAKNEKTIGICGGQTSRVDAVKIALKRAGEDAKGAVLASDGFFPFPDSVDIMSKYGIVAYVSPGGSIYDDQVINTADEFEISAIHTKKRVFLH